MIRVAKTDPFVRQAHLAKAHSKYGRSSLLYARDLLGANIPPLVASPALGRVQIDLAPAAHVDFGIDSLEWATPADDDATNNTLDDDEGTRNEKRGQIDPNKIFPGIDTGRRLGQGFPRLQDRMDVVQNPKHMPGSTIVQAVPTQQVAQAKKMTRTATGSVGLATAFPAMMAKLSSAAGTAPASSVRFSTPAITPTASAKVAGLALEDFNGGERAASYFF